jgi:hypothetical protein
MVLFKRVTDRRLLLTLKHDETYFVIVAAEPDIFTLQKRERATAKAQSILTAQGKGPWPLFTCSFNVMQKDNRYCQGSFISKRVEYDALLIADCGMLGEKEGTSPLQALEEHNFMLIPLEAHPLETDIKRVLRIT